tara:strand:- start:257 stop:427 length:171 start_codon:yes stop_codon:yes gene_type:complete
MQVGILFNKKGAIYNFWGNPFKINNSFLGNKLNKKNSKDTPFKLKTTNFYYIVYES